MSDESTPDRVGDWRPISDAPRDTKEYHLAWFYEPSDEAARNGARAHWTYGSGARLFPQSDLWCGILGMRPSHWRPVV